MREILFRGKRIDNGEWIEGYYKLHGIHMGTIEEEFYPTIAPLGNCQISYEVDPSTVGQYTGINDWNGKEIFEGDFIRLDGGVKRGFEITDGVVIFERGGFYVGESGPLNSLDVIAAYDGILRGEVIGNIHDNPELMEDEK